ncbi:MAG: isoprenylcysteine carboxylmethyltransferase family protein [Rhodospirillales bacterium]|nr:isoprenylcysteine carboxylmethyltransferase family protein [Rhodospirillales bacterium]
MEETQAYGLWPLVIVNAGIFVMFAFSFAKPKSPRDWRSLGAFSAFVLALFTEMYGFPLTIYLLSGWLSELRPHLDLFSHEAGHLWSTLSGSADDPHFTLPHLISNILIVAGFIIVARSWRVLHAAQRVGMLATSGPYARVRHPQYGGFVLVMLGLLFQWPTLVTAAMFPILVVAYVRLARAEERSALAEFGEAYRSYMKEVPGFIPHLGSPSNRSGSSGALQDG